MFRKLPKTQWLPLPIYCVLLIGIYYSSLVWLIGHDWVRGDYNYCYLIPLIVLYLLWEKRKIICEMPSSPSWYGTIPVVLAISLFWIGELAGEFFTSYLSMWLLIIGLCWIHLGWKKLKKVSFPLFLILTMFPLPLFINNRLTLKLKLISSQLGVWLMQAWGMSAYREGNIIDLGFTQLQVVDACSGLRYLFPLVVLGILLAYFYKASLWKRIVLVLSTIPLSILTNAFRIALTGVLYGVWGPKVAEGFFHGFSGWFIFMFSLFILLLEMKVLSVFGSAGSLSREPKGTRVDKSNESVESVKSSGKAVRRTGSKSRDGNPIQNSKFKIQNSLFPPHFIVAVILLGSTLALSRGVEFREKIPMSRSFSEFPLKIDGWVGTRGYMERKFIKELDLSDYIIVDYKNNAGKVVNFYVAYYQTQSKGKSIHSPSTCLPGAGWIFRQAGEATIPTPGYYGGHIKVRRAYMEKSGYQQVSYYWFPQRGRILTNAYQLKIYNFWDALTKHRTDGALVRVITPVYKGEAVKDADRRLQGFVRQIVPILATFIPS